MKFLLGILIAGLAWAQIATTLSNGGPSFQASYDPFKNRYAVGDTVAAGGSTGGASVMITNQGFLVECGAERFELSVGFEESVMLTSYPPQTQKILRFQEYSGTCQGIGNSLMVGGYMEIPRLRTIRIRLLKEVVEINLDRDGLHKKGTK